MPRVMRRLMTPPCTTSMALVLIHKGRSRTRPRRSRVIMGSGETSSRSIHKGGWMISAMINTDRVLTSSLITVEPGSKTGLVAAAGKIPG